MGHFPRDNRSTSIPTNTFSKLFQTSALSDLTKLSSPEEFVTCYNSSISEILNTLAPLKTRCVPATRTSPWFTPELRIMKVKVRRLERLYKKTALSVHFTLFTE